MVLGGVAAALHVGKLPPALPVLREAFSLDLVQAGFLLSLVQLAGMVFGAAAGLAADRWGLKRTMVAGLAIVGLASIGGGSATAGAGILLLLRALEGFGFLLASMPAPGLIRRSVEPERVSPMLGVWGAYMPFATALAMLCGPAVLSGVGWPGWWWMLGSLSLGMSLWLAHALPPDPERHCARRDPRERGRLHETLASRGPWLVAVAFGVYSAQWLAVIGFLPSLYLGAGIPAATVAVATAAAAAVNIVGNVAAGRLLARGVAGHHLLRVGYAAMGMGAWIAFSESTSFLIGYAAVLTFSMVGGLVPGTLFSLALRMAPSQETVSTTVGWMQQWSALGQFAGPPAAAWAATATGSWRWAGAVTGCCALVGLLMAHWSSHALRPVAALESPAP